MRLLTLTIRCSWQMTPGNSVTGQDASVLVMICRNCTQSHVRQYRNLIVLRSSCALSHVSHRELSSTPADSHHKLFFMSDVVRMFHVLQRLQVQGSFTRGKPIAIAASLVKPSLGHLCPCTYPCQSYKRCADRGPSQGQHLVRSTTQASTGADGKKTVR